MTVRTATPADLDSLRRWLPQANSSTDELSARLSVLQLSCRPEHQVLVFETTPGAPLGLAVTGHDPDGYEGALLHALVVPDGAYGRRLAARLLESLVTRLRDGGVQELWIRAELLQVNAFVRQGAVEVAHAPPAFGSDKPRRLLRLYTGTQPVELTTPRLRLRAWQSADYDPFAHLNADIEVNRWLPGPMEKAASDALAARLDAELRRYGFGMWVVSEGGNTSPLVQPFLGFVGIAPVLHIPQLIAHLGGPALELAWRILPEFQGRGFATEAAAAAVRHAREQLHVDELVAITVAGNRASARVMEKLGMHRDPAGDFEHPRLPVGHPLRPHLLYRFLPTR